MAVNQSKFVIEQYGYSSVLLIDLVRKAYLDSSKKAKSHWADVFKKFKLPSK